MSGQNPITERPLTPKESAFVTEYLIDFNGGAAAIRAGYSPKSAYSIASENLRKPKIQKAMKAEFQARIQRTRGDQDKVLKEVEALAFTDIRDYLSWYRQTAIVGGDRLQDAELGEDENGEPIVLRSGMVIEAKNSDKLTDIQAKAVKSVKLTKDGDFELELYSKDNALQLLMRHLGMLQDDKISLKDVMAQVDLETEILRAVVREFAPDAAERIFQEFARRLGEI